MEQNGQAQAYCSSGHARPFVFLRILGLLVMKSLLTLRRTRDASPDAPNLTFSCLKGRPQELPVYSLPSKSGRLRRVFSIAAARRHFSTSAWFPPIRTSGTAQPRYSAGRV